MGVKQRLLTGAALRTGNMALNVAISFVMMPYFVQSLGDRTYGLWVLVGTSVGYFHLFDLGLSSAVTRFISRAIGKGAVEDVREITSTSFYIFVLIALAVLAAAGGLAAAAPRFVSNPGEAALVRELILILGLNLALSVPVRVFNGALVADLRYDKVTLVDIGRVLVSTAGMVAVLEAGHGVRGMAWVQLLCSQADNAVRVVMALRTARGMSIAPAHFRRSRVRILFGYSVYTFLGHVADLLRFKVDSLVIAAFLGAGRVTHYFIAARLIEYFIQMMTSAMGILTPLFSQYEGRNDYRSIQEKFLLTTKVSVVLATLVGGLVALFGEAFIERWMGPAYLDAYPVLMVLVIPTTLALMQLPSVNVLYGISKHRFYTYANGIEGVLNLLISLALVRPYGMLGVALGTALPMAAMKLVVQPVYVCRAVGLPYGRYMACLARSMAVSALAILGPWLFLKGHLMSNYVSIAGLAGLNAALYLAIVAWGVFNQEERNVLSPLTPLRQRAL